MLPEGSQQEMKSILISLLFDSSDNSTVGACITLLSILIRGFYPLLSLKSRKASQDPHKIRVY